MGKSALDFGKTVVLVGKTGNGKSATGNSIIGADVFDSMPSFGGVIAATQMHRSVLADGQILNVIDTPGLFDSSIDPKSIGKEIAKSINMAKNGIHAVLVVVSLGCRFSLEEESAIESLRQFFGGKIGDYMILVFTHGDALGKMSIDDFLARNCPKPLAKTIRLCGGRYVLFDNVTEDEVKKSRQLKELLCLVDTVVDNNDGIPYTNELFVNSPEVSGNGLTKEYEDQMNGFLERIESKLRETALTLEKQLGEERIARMEAEAKAREAHIKLCNEMNRVMLDLERAHRDADVLQKIQTETEAKFKENEKRIARIEAGKIEWKLRETALMLEKQLAEERTALMEAGKIESELRETALMLEKQLAVERTALTEAGKIEWKLRETALMLEKQLGVERTALMESGKIESELRESALMLEKQLAEERTALMEAGKIESALMLEMQFAEERIARMEAEDKARKAQNKACKPQHKVRKLKNKALKSHIDFIG